MDQCRRNVPAATAILATSAVAVAAPPVQTFGVVQVKPVDASTELVGKDGVGIEGKVSSSGFTWYILRTEH